MSKNLSPSAHLSLITDLDALSHNYHFLCSQISNKTVCAAVLKANAYGMGAKDVSVHLYKLGCRHFFVANLPEAIEIKKLIGNPSSIYVLNGLKS